MQQGLVKWLVSSPWKGSRWLHPTSGPQCVEHSLSSTLFASCLQWWEHRWWQKHSRKSPDLTTIQKRHLVTTTRWEWGHPLILYEPLPILLPFIPTFQTYFTYLLTLNNTTFNMLIFIRPPNISGRILNFPLINLDLFSAPLLFFLTEGQFINICNCFLNLKAEAHVR